MIEFLLQAVVYGIAAIFVVVCVRNIFWYFSAAGSEHRAKLKAERAKIYASRRELLLNGEAWLVETRETVVLRNKKNGRRVIMLGRGWEDDVYPVGANVISAPRLVRVQGVKKDGSMSSSRAYWTSTSNWEPVDRCSVTIPVRRLRGKPQRALD